MARIVLQPCKLREDEFVPTKEQPSVFDWKQLSKKLAPSRDIKARHNLLLLQPQAFVGLLVTSKGASNFVLMNENRSGNIATIVARDPSFLDRLLEVYRVEEVTRDASVSEMPGFSKGPRRAI